jgi:hypothetical protein
VTNALPEVLRGRDDLLWLRWLQQKSTKASSAIVLSIDAEFPWWVYWAWCLQFCVPPTLVPYTSGIYIESDSLTVAFGGSLGFRTGLYKRL